MNFKRMMIASSMALALIGISSTVQAEDGSLRLRTMLADRDVSTVTDTNEPVAKAGQRKKLIMNYDELFLKKTKKAEKNDDKDS
ncbi:hypothetical protein KEM63_01250 [Halopseudomonas nanhaiensis]|jgi:hypothetical protein|uniref:hypothetical protein n=1 Tax=Halopseudomonas nanhaiensis TaxID=2830842 RepID=UPI001CBA92D2|nr:hypothetical protein [Halopseudomonas nanhaiensis]UAW98641.1 hypothetical protein KEM63_01250 [Halopseudomonas nanhaiensis]